MRTVTPQLVRTFSALTDCRDDGELLSCFLDCRDEESFAQLVRKYGPMVWGICRRSLPDPTDAEDAFQAVFLVLLRRGRGLTGRASLGPWLHRVAVWTARNARRRNARQLGHRVAFPEAASAAPADVDLSFDLQTALASLPEKFRDSIVLCHLLGYSRADAAAQLGCAERTLKLWLAQGLERLRVKLPGLDPARALALAAIAVPAGLSQSLLQAASSCPAAAIATSMVSSTVSQLVQGVMRMFWIKKATAATVALFTVFAFGLGVGVSTHQAGSAVGGDDKPAAAQPQPPARQSEKSVAGFEKKLVDAIHEQSHLVSEEKSLRDQIGEEWSRVAKGGHSSEDPVKRLEVLVGQLRQTQKKLKDIDHVVEQLQSSFQVMHQGMGQSAEVLWQQSCMQCHVAAQGKGHQFLDAAKPQPTPPAPVPPKDVDTRLKELQKQLAEAQRTLEESNLKQLEQANQERLLKERIEQVKKSIEEIRKLREKEDRSDNWSENPAAAAGAYLQLAVSGKDAEWLYRVQEFDRGGKLMGQALLNNDEMLQRFLKRTWAQADGPKQLRVVGPAHSAATANAVKSVKLMAPKGIIVVASGEGDDRDKMAEELSRALQFLEQRDRDEATKREREAKRSDELLLRERQARQQAQQAREQAEAAFQAEREAKLAAQLTAELQRQKAVVQALEAQLRAAEVEMRKEVEKRKVEEKSQPQKPATPPVPPAKP